MALLQMQACPRAQRRLMLARTSQANRTHHRRLHHKSSGSLRTQCREWPAWMIRSGDTVIVDAPVGHELALPGNIVRGMPFDEHVDD